MAEDRKLPTEGLVEPDVFGQRRDPLLGADDVGDPHQVVVDHVGEVVGRVAVGLEQHLVVDLGVGDRDVAPQEVVGHGVAVFRHGEPDHMGLSRFAAPRRLRRVDRPAETVVAELALGGALFGAQGVEPLAGAETRVGGAGGHQLFHVLAVDLGPSRSAGRARADRRRRAPRPTRARASAGLRGSSPRSRWCCARGRCPRSAARMNRRSGAPGRD